MIFPDDYNTKVKSKFIEELQPAESPETYLAIHLITSHTVPGNILAITSSFINPEHNYY